MADGAISDIEAQLEQLWARYCIAPKTYALPINTPHRVQLTIGIVLHSKRRWKREIIRRTYDRAVKFSSAIQQSFTFHQAIVSTEMPSAAFCRLLPPSVTTDTA